MPLGGDNIRYISHHVKCCKCECELISGYDYHEINGDFYCDSCWEQYLEDFSDEHRCTVEDYEELI